MVKRSSRQGGISYLALLLVLALVNAGLAAGAMLWSQQQRRERETHLLWAGDQIRRAIAAYAQSGADAANAYPASLQDLLLDPRSAAPRRHLRRIYDEPMARDGEWGLLHNAQGRIVGVHSRATAQPLKTGSFAAPYAHFERASSYADWRFAAVPDSQIVERRAAGRGEAP